MTFSPSAERSWALVIAALAADPKTVTRVTHIQLLDAVAILARSA